MENALKYLIMSIFFFFLGFIRGKSIFDKTFEKKLIEHVQKQIFLHFKEIFSFCAPVI